MQHASASAGELLQRIKSKTAVIGVIGLGYVGLPLCLAIVASGSSVIGFDIDPAKARSLAAGQSYMSQIPHDAVRSLVASGRFTATTDASLLPRADVILICVPTPLTPQREPDLAFVVATARTIAEYLRPGQLVVLESTTYPGTTEEVLRPILEGAGPVCGRDFFLAYSPEREDPGNSSYSTSDIPKIVGGLGAGCELAAAVYSNFVSQVVPVSSPATAEAVKITENVFRAVNIALANELKVVFQAMDIDIWEVIDAAKTKPFGFMPFYPGPGLGGHCVPIDPFYLTWKAREYGIATRFIELAGQINGSMPDYVVNRLSLALDAGHKVGLNGTRVLVVGIAYKKNVDDTRESPGLRLIELIEARGASVDFYDPFVSAIPATRTHMRLAGRRSIDWEPASLSTYRAAVIATDHDTIDYSILVENCKLIVDTRNACGRAGICASHIVRA